MLSPELRTKAEELVGRYPNPRSALLPLLHLVQAQDGYVSPDGIAECAALLDLTKAEVNAVATFYTMYKREEMGRHLVSVCTNFSCKVRGAAEVYARAAENRGAACKTLTLSRDGRAMVVVCSYGQAGEVTLELDAKRLGLPADAVATDLASGTPVPRVDGPGPMRFRLDLPRRRIGVGRRRQCQTNVQRQMRFVVRAQHH